MTTREFRGDAVRVEAKAADFASLALKIEGRAFAASAGACVVEIASAAVNPSDVKATLGLMPHAVFPRTPGRDYAGIVVAGPRALVGKEVWGSGGDLGMTRDGTHARYLVLPTAHVREKPRTLSLAEASGVGVPFITAHTGFAAADGIAPGAIVLIAGIHGKVGQAAAQLAAMAGARLFGLARTDGPYRGHASGAVTMLDGRRPDIAERLLAATGGHGADIVYNTVGSPYFDAANAAMATGGRQILISTVERRVAFDIVEFYRGRRAYFGVDSLALDAGRCAEILERLRPGFESGTLRPFPIDPANVFPLARVREAYAAVLGDAFGRILLTPA